MPDPGLLRTQRAEFAAAVHAGIGAAGLPLRELADRLTAGYGSLASSVATLSAWQTGSSAPPGTSAGIDRVLALERTLGLPAGDLALLVPGGAVPSHGRLDRPARPAAGKQALLRHVGAVLAGPHLVVPVEVAKDRRLGADRQMRRTAVGMRVRALADGVDRVWYVHAPDPRLRTHPCSGPGCHVGREIVRAGGPGDPPLLAVELVLDRTLARGETHDLAFEIEHEPVTRGGQAPPAAVFRHVQPQPCERLDLSVSFPRGTTPAEMLQVRWRQRDLAEVWRSRTTLPGCRQYRQVVDDPAPGGYGYRWGWPAATAHGSRRPGRAA